MKNQFAKFELANLRALLISPSNFIDCLHFIALAVAELFIAKSNFIINFTKLELQIILQIQVPYLILRIVNQIFIHFNLIIQAKFVKSWLLEKLFLFLIFFLFFFYNLNRHYLRLNQDCYLNLTVLFFSILLFFYVMDPLQCLKFLCMDHKDHLHQIILSFRIQAQQYLHCQNLRIFYLKLVQQVNCQMKMGHFQNFVKLFH